MGAALVENIVKKREPRGVIVFDRDKEKMTALVKHFGVRAAYAAQELIDLSNVVILALKPQDMKEALGGLKGWKGKLGISIAAGLDLSQMASWTDVDLALVRAMPNLNALIGRSMTGLAFNAKVTPSERDLAEEIFKAVGRVVFVDEKYMHAVTAIAGSGPAFVAYVSPELSDKAIEDVMTAQAINFGLSQEQALTLAHETISGTQEMLKANLDAPTLMKRVSSRGGTTEAGMKVLQESGKTKEALAAAIQAAEKKAGELARRA